MLEGNFIRIYTKKSGFVPHYSNPQAVVPISRDDNFIVKKNLSSQKNHMSLVYSTSSSTKNQPPLVVRLDTKINKGKPATVIEGFVISGDTVNELARKIKTKCGTGGTVKDQSIIIQGNLLDRVKKILAEEGFQVK